MTEQNAFTTISVDRSGPIATMTLQRPEALNALNQTMIDELALAFDGLAADPTIRVILLTGSGEKAFAAGADIRGLLQADAAAGEANSKNGQRVFAQIERTRKPVIACINGVALGGGLELAMACTLRIASDNARVGLPEARLGLVPGYGGTVRAARLAGRGAALRMMLTGQPITAADARAVGLVDYVVPPAELMARAKELGSAIAGMAPLAVAAVLELLDCQSQLTTEEAMRAESNVFARLCGTADKTEGLTAFLEKRLPVWQGK